MAKALDTGSRFKSVAGDGFLEGGAGRCALQGLVDAQGAGRPARWAGTGCATGTRCDVRSGGSSGGAIIP
ncbi:hypothetical protein HEK616_32950 [Streptomyces nigrescens]|uniref:Uncharacterized protein n=1 Tax=Streptomyces nigrescens TaxID=1920 RepID=A0ABN6QUF6_STRNI|nr:hypothetical protein HEK616_32950 [Streptomyces nigrescens]